jgi:hypothetical protein
MRSLPAEGIQCNLGLSVGFLKEGVDRFPGDDPFLADAPAADLSLEEELPNRMMPEPGV